MNDRWSLSHTLWECKYQCCMDIEVQKEVDIRGIAELFWINVPRARESEILESHFRVWAHNRL